MGKGTCRVKQSNLRFFTFLVFRGMISAPESGLFIGHKIIINICRTLNTFFSKQYLDTIRSRLDRSVELPVNVFR